MDREALRVLLEQGVGRADRRRFGGTPRPSHIGSPSTGSRPGHEKHAAKGGLTERSWRRSSRRAARFVRSPRRWIAVPARSGTGSAATA